MTNRLAVVLASSVLACALTGLVACSTPDPGPASPLDVAEDVDEAEDVDGRTAEAEDGDDTGTTGTSDAPKSKVEAPSMPADPACVESCDASLAPKCGDGKEGYCESICRSFTNAQVQCMGEASTCEKAEWIRCREENPE